MATCGRFDLVKKIGEGGFGKVFAATFDTDDGKRSCALKLMEKRPGLPESVVDDFLNECET